MDGHSSTPYRFLIASVVRKNGEREKVDALDGAKMLDTVMVISKSISQQTRHLRDRLEPETTERC